MELVSARLYKPWRGMGGWASKTERMRRNSRGRPGWWNWPIIGASATLSLLKCCAPRLASYKTWPTRRVPPGSGSLSRLLVAIRARRAAQKRRRPRRGRSQGRRARRAPAMSTGLCFGASLARRRDVGAGPARSCSPIGYRPPNARALLYAPVPRERSGVRPAYRSTPRSDAMR